MSHPSVFRFFDVLLDRGNNASVFIRQRINIKLRRPLQKLIDQNWPVRSKANRGAHVIIQALFVVNDGHCATAQYITGRTSTG